MPRTLKAGSILVSRIVAEAVDVADADALTVEVGVGKSVRVTLKAVGKTSTIARVREPELAIEVEVKEVVSGITVTLAESVGVDAAGEVDWAAVERMRDAYRRRGRRTLEGWTRASQGIR
jgi:hypothetical protein